MAYGFEKLEAYQVVSQGGHSRIANVVDPNYTIVAKFPKRLLPREAVTGCIHRVRRAIVCFVL